MKTTAYVAVLLGLSQTVVAGETTLATEVLGRSAHGHYQEFDAGVPVAIEMRGDGATDLDITVRDSNGNLVAIDEDTSDTCIVTFVPRRTGTYFIRIWNCGRALNRYTLRIETLVSQNQESPRLVQEAAISQRGKVRVRNSTPLNLDLRVNGSIRRIPAYAIGIEIEVPVGTVTTELVGYERPRTWTIGPPNYLAAFEIAYPSQSTTPAAAPPLVATTQQR